jgi:osmotically-inducible protein OsmY
MSRYVSLSFCAVLLLTTAACGPAGLAVGAGAAVGTAASREGGIGQTMADKRIHMYINDAWFKRSTEMFRKLNLSVTEGRVLVTGVVQDQQTRLDAIRLAWQAPGVKQVINEVKVENSEGISGYTRDTWIGTQLRSRMVFDKYIESINYTNEVVGGVVYMMGVAQNQEELNRVINHARSIRYVKEVVSYVRLRGTSVTESSYMQGSTGMSNNAYSNQAVPVTQGTQNQGAQNQGTVQNNNSNASQNYEYQPESRNAKSSIESSDLPPLLP